VVLTTDIVLFGDMRGPGKRHIRPDAISLPPFRHVINVGLPRTMDDFLAHVQAQLHLVDRRDSILLVTTLMSTDSDTEMARKLAVFLHEDRQRVPAFLQDMESQLSKT
jgi:hypothetical protein